jgi:hypothetical protein
MLALAGATWTPLPAMANCASRSDSGPCCCGPDAACELPDDDLGMESACCDLRLPDDPAAAPVPAPDVPRAQNAHAPVPSVSTAAPQLPAAPAAPSPDAVPATESPPRYHLFCTYLI